jgi:hypothetical protein
MLKTGDGRCPPDPTFNPTTAMIIQLKKHEDTEHTVLIDGKDVGTIHYEGELGFQANIIFGSGIDRDYCSKFGKTAEIAIRNSILSAVKKYEMCLADAKRLADGLSEDKTHE